MSTRTITDREILETVADALAGEHTDWTDRLDNALEDLGLTLGETPDGSDVWLLARLADGREIWLADESAQGWRRYSIGHPDEALDP